VAFRAFSHDLLFVVIDTYYTDASTPIIAWPN
jgi:hypothetical protein